MTTFPTNVSDSNWRTISKYLNTERNRKYELRAKDLSEFITIEDLEILDLKRKLDQIARAIGNWNQ
jgi:hypothetical protein